MNRSSFRKRPKNSRNQNRKNSGFTLIELVISATVSAIILAAAYMCLNAGISSQKVIEPRTEALQTARVALAMMSADLRSACPLSKESEFLGMQREIDGMEADNLDFATHNYMPRKAGEGDYCQMSYFVEKDAKTGEYCLCRRRNPVMALDPLSGGSREEIARGLTGLQLEYYDGYDWYDEWGDLKKDQKQKKTADASNLTGMPEAVRITLSLESEPRSKNPENPEKPPAPPLVFQTVVRLELASTLAAAASEGTGGDSAQSSQNGGNRQ